MTVDRKADSLPDFFREGDILNYVEPMRAHCITWYTRDDGNIGK